ncbi:MAG: response regulator [Deferribacteres bacterium]|nr:response regulator [Deferribacteres bacterium]
MKILIVDDNEDSRIILKTTLELDGHIVEEAPHGLKALKMAKESMPDIFISDILMPVMDGFSLCREVKQDEKLRKIPFVFYTATYLDPKDEKLAASLGASRYIVKPMDFDKFLKIIKEVFQEYSEKRLLIPEKPTEEEPELFRMYQDSVVRMLDKKVQELENEIVKRKKMEEELERLNVELTHKNKELKQVLYVTSHDLRTPLVNIEGYSKELEYSLKDLLSAVQSEDVPAHIKETIAPIVDKDIPEAVKYINASISKMNSMLSGLLKLSRMGQVVLKIQQIDMNKLMSDILCVVEYQIKNMGVTLDVTDLPPCRGDESQINQVFSNLISNALKFLDPARPGVIRISGRRENGHSVYCVEDNGIGIAPEYQEKIFEMFHRLDTTVDGEGLGLIIARNIVERHHGKIWIESEPGRGCEFYVSIPA